MLYYKKITSISFYLLSATIGGLINHYYNNETINSLDEKLKIMNKNNEEYLKRLNILSENQKKMRDDIIFFKNEIKDKDKYLYKMKDANTSLLNEAIIINEKNEELLKEINDNEASYNQMLNLLKKKNIDLNESLEKSEKENEILKSKLNELRLEYDDLEERYNGYFEDDSNLYNEDDENNQQYNDTCVI